jgi:hypothetical protein
MMMAAEDGAGAAGVGRRLRLPPIAAVLPPEGVFKPSVIGSRDGVCFSEPNFSKELL